MLFVLHDKGIVSKLIAVRLGNFIDFLCSTPKYQKLGWNTDVFETAARYKVRYPQLQFKVPAHIGRLNREHPELFEELYNGNS